VAENYLEDNKFCQNIKETSENQKMSKTWTVSFHHRHN